MIRSPALGASQKVPPPLLLVSGATGISESGRLPVNLSGGALSANPIFATGLIRLAEAALQVTGQAVGYQADARTAVAHATSGFALQSNIVYVLDAQA